MTLLDEELLLRVIAGDEEAFTMLYRRHHPAIYRFVLLMSGSEATAEDVTQEVFLFFMREAERYDASRAALSTYLCGIARNYVLRILRRDRYDDPWPEKGDPVAVAGSVVPGNPLADCEREQQIEMVRKAVLALPPHYREVVVLCDFHGMKYADAAEAVGCSAGTICSRLHREHLLLWERLQENQTRTVATSQQKGCS